MKDVANKTLAALCRDTKRAKVTERFATLSLTREIIAGENDDGGDDDDDDELNLSFCFLSSLVIR